MTDDVISDGDSVTVNYTGNYENGEIFDSSIEEKAKESEFYDPQRKYGPICIKLGAGQIVKGFEKALLGMKKGEEKRVTIPPEEAYGNVDPNLVQSVPMEAFKEAKISPEVDLMLDTREGVGRITKVNTEDVELDFNNPMAGKTLVFNIKVEDIEKWDGKEDCDDPACGCPCGGR